MNESDVIPGAGRITRDRTGERFGRLVVLQMGRRRRSGSGAMVAVCLCRCECGVEKWILAGNLTAGRTKGCGCGNTGPERGELRRLCDDRGVSFGLVSSRVRRGWPLELAMTAPVGTKHLTEVRAKLWIGERTAASVAAEHGVSRQLLHRRIQCGWSVERAATTPPAKRGRAVNRS